MSQELNKQDRQILLKIAREALEKSVRFEPLPEIKIKELPLTLQAYGASFVTLTIDNSLRGCIGTLEAYLPLAEDVQQHTAAAALQDNRFPIVQPEECSKILIEISVLSPKAQLEYDQPHELTEKLRPGIDGVVLQDGFRKATFLPQVWAKLPDPHHFLSHLCLKMGASEDLWQEKPLQVYTYQVQEFHE